MSNINFTPIKKILLITLLNLALRSSNCFAQPWINSISVQPANPTSADTVRMLVECSFPSGACDPYLVNSSAIGNDIYGSALHCLGMLAVICNYTDTFTINPLASGNYKFHMQLDAGGGPAPCTPGIVPGPVDSISFIVTPSSGVIDPPAENNFEITYDPYFQQLLILAPKSLLLSGKNIVCIFSADGKLVIKKELALSTSPISISLNQGFYFASLFSGSGTKLVQKFSVIK